MHRDTPDRSASWQVLGVCLVTASVALLLARAMLAPAGYYGTLTAPRFSDAWFERAETIIGGGNLYRDAETMTPPLINLLLIPPVVAADWFQHQNPGATLAFMLYFALFNLGTATLLLFHTNDRGLGRDAALVFLLNPLTAGNAILRRQDEAILVFGFALVVWLMLRRRHTWASLALGGAMLIKLTAGLLIPIGLLTQRRWRYIGIPPLVFALTMAPFLLSAGVRAAFWNPSQRHAQHPFQFDGINPIALWFVPQGVLPPTPLLLFWSVLFVTGIGVTLVLIAHRPRGIWEDVSLLLGVTLLLTPKLHGGYFALLALTLAPIAARYRIGGLAWWMGFLILLADFLKWPAERFLPASVVMIAAFGLLIAILWRIRRAPAHDTPASTGSVSPAHLSSMLIRRPRLSATVLALTAGLLAYAFASPQERQYDIGTSEDYLSAATLLEREQRNGQTFRWTAPGTLLALPGASHGSVVLSLRLFHDDKRGSASPQLQLYDQHGLNLRFNGAPGWRVYRVLRPPLPLSADGVAAAQVGIASDQYRSTPGDNRKRGTAIDWVHVRPLSGVSGLSGEILYQPLLLVVGLMIVWETSRYLGTVLCNRSIHRRLAQGLDCSHIVAACGLVFWAYQDLPSLVWSLPLSPGLLLVTALLLSVLFLAGGGIRSAASPRATTS